MSTKVPSAKMTLLKNLSKCRKGDSVRVTGLWAGYDASNKIGYLEFEGVRAKVDISNLDEPVPERDDTVQCLGEITEIKDTTATVKVRVMRIVNTLDMHLYTQVVEIQNSVL